MTKNNQYVLFLVFGFLTVAIGTCPAKTIANGDAGACSSGPQATGTSCAINCIPGYWVNGLIQATCQADGTWLSGSCGGCPQHWWLNSAITSPVNIGQINDFYYPDWDIHGYATFSAPDQDMGVLSVRECPGSTMGGFLIDRVSSTLGIYFDSSYTSDARTYSGWFRHGGNWPINTQVTFGVTVRSGVLTLTLNGVSVTYSGITVTPNIGHNWWAGIQETCNPMSGSLDYITINSCMPRCAPDNSGPVNGNGGTCNAYNRVYFPCDVACNPGYTISGTTTRTCQDTYAYTAIDPSATCTQYICTNAAVPVNAHIVSGCTGSDVYPNTCVLACDPGYYKSAGTLSYTCSGPGNYPWSLTCLPITCSNPALPTGAVITSGCSGVDAYLGTCNVACAAGYTFSGTSSYTCLTPGAYAWSFSCTPITCSNPALPTGAVITSGCSGVDAYLGTCNVGCSAGYSFSGTSSYTCLSPGAYAWSFSCTPIVCSTPALPANSHILSGCTGADPFGSSCVLRCDTGFYNYVGNFGVVCNLPISGPYSFSLGCAAITCNGTTYPLPDGAAIVSGCTSTDAYNSSCILKCSNGYTYTSGSYSRTCLALAPAPYAASNLVCTAFTPKNITGVYTNGWTTTALGTQFLASSPDGITTYLASFTNDSTHVEVYVNGSTYTGIVNMNGSTVTGITWSLASLGTWVFGSPVAQAYVYPLTLTFLPDSSMCFAPGFTELFPWNFCTAPGSCYYRRNYNIWEGNRGVCMSPCNASLCQYKSGLSLRGTDKYCNGTGATANCVAYQPIGGTCGGYDANNYPVAPFCNWKSVCLNTGASWTCQNSTCLNTCEYGSYCYTSTTTSDTAICGGYEVPAFTTEQYTEFLAIYAGYLPGQPLQARHQRKHIQSVQTGADLIGQLPCNPSGPNQCGLSGACVLDPSDLNHYCVSPGLYQGGVPIP